MFYWQKTSPLCKILKCTVHFPVSESSRWRIRGYLLPGWAVFFPQDSPQEPKPEHTGNEAGSVTPDPEDKGHLCDVFTESLMWLHPATMAFLSSEVSTRISGNQGAPVTWEPVGWGLQICLKVHPLLYRGQLGLSSSLANNTSFNGFQVVWRSHGCLGSSLDLTPRTIQSAKILFEERITN